MLLLLKIVLAQTMKGKNCLSFTIIYSYKYLLYIKNKNVDCLYGMAIIRLRIKQSEVIRIQYIYSRDVFYRFES